MNPTLTKPAPAQKTRFGWQQLPYYLLLAGLLVFMTGYIYPFQNHAEDLPPFLHLEDQALYEKDFYVQQMLQPTPRFYYQRFIALLSPGAQAIPTTLYAVWVLAIAAFFLSLIRISLKLTNAAWPGWLVFFMLLVHIDNTGTWGAVMWLNHSLLANLLGSACVGWAIALALGGRWAGSFALLAVAAVFQLLFGLFGMVVMVPIYWLGLWQRQRFAQPLAWLLPGIAAAGLVVAALPMLLANTTGSAALSGQEFIDVFIKFRTPHHNLPSLYVDHKNLKNNLGFAAAITLLYLWLPALKPWRWVGLWAVGISLVFVASAWVVVELAPIPALAKLQLARMTVFMQLAGFVALAVWCWQAVQDRKWVLALAIPLLVFSIYAGLFLFLLVLAWRFDRKYAPVQISALLVLAASVAAYRPYSWGANFLAYLKEPGAALAFALLVLAVVLAYDWLNRRPALTLGLGLATLLLIVAPFSASLTAMLPEAVIAGLTKRINRDAANILTLTPGPRERGLVDLAQDFKNNTPTDALVVTPLHLEGAAFKMFSQRANVVDFKNVPYTDAGIVEWRRRLELFLPRPVTAYEPSLGLQDTLFQAYHRLSIERLAHIGRSYGARYILAAPDQQQGNARLPVFMENRHFVIYTIN